jgi:hypothetical protein
MNGVMSRSLMFLWVILLAAGGFAVTLTTFHVLLVSHWEGPFRDMWEIYPFLVKISQNSWEWSDLWESYGYAHRLVIPRLFFIADYQFSDANNHLLITLSLLCQLGIVGLFGRALFAQSSLSLWERWCLFLVIIIFQFSGTLLFNFMHTFDVQWFLCCFFVATALFLLALKTSGRDVIFLVISGMFIALGCLSNFSAMAAWPVWMFFVFYRAISKWYRWALLSLSIAFIAVYATGIKSSTIDAVGAVNILAASTYIFLKFPLLYLGNPVSDPDYLPFGNWAAILVAIPLLLLLRFVWNLFKTPSTEWNGACLFFASLMVFCFGVAVMTGLGRGYDPSHVYASRYQNVVMLYWSAAIPFLFMETNRMAITAKALWRVGGLLFLAGLIACQVKSWSENLLLGRNVSRSHLALMMGYSDNVPMIFATVSRSMIYVPGYNLEKERMLHQESRKGIYTGDMSRDWLEGIQLSGVSTACEGVEWSINERVTPYTNFVEFLVTGDVQSYDYALLIDETGSVVALAKHDKEIDLIKSFTRIVKDSGIVLRGYSKVRNYSGLSLVMVSAEGRCFRH